jgi:hypothetical protein
MRLWLLAVGLLLALAEEPLTSDFTPPIGRGIGPEAQGPWSNRLMSAVSSDGLTFTRTNQVITDQGDVPDLVQDSRGRIYLYYVCWTVGNERNKIVVAISQDGGRNWIYKKTVLAGFEGMSDPVDPDVQILSDGTFRLYVTAAAHDEGPRTYYAEGSDGIQFERKGVAFDPPNTPLDPSTLAIGDTWHIFAGGPTRQPGANWHGTSSDGRVFAFDEEMGFVKDERPHAMSNGIAVEGGYRFYAFPHTEVPVINSFFTTDGVSWRAEPGTRLEMDASTGLESAGVKDAAVVRLADGTYFMVYVTQIPECIPRAASPELDFTPDPGVRVENASLPKPAVDEGGGLYLYYQDNSARPPREFLAVSSDGLSFPAGAIPRDRANDPRRLRLPDGTWRLYVCDPQAGVMRSASSRDGLQFAQDAGVRYAPQPEDRGTIGVYDHFADSAGGVALLYVGDMQGVNNVRRAYSPPGDNGWTFRFEAGNVLGDAEAGGGPNSYVDQKSVRLSDGRLRLFAMKRGTIYSFLSEDEGRSFHQEPGVRLAPRDFKEFRVISLHDPWVVRLADGRYRMYVAAALEGGPVEAQFAIVSATTPVPGAASTVTGAYVMAFHACDTAATDCSNPQNHLVYLAQSDDGREWGLVPGWVPFRGSVPDVIRRGQTLYVYSAGAGLVRHRLEGNRQEAPVQVSVSGLEGGFVDPSLTVDERGRLVLFFLYGRPGGDPAGCPAGQLSCVNRIGSATEVAGSDGAEFTLDPGDRLTVTLSTAGPVRTASDPDVFFDGRQYVLYLSHGPSISVWRSAELRGTYEKIADLAQGTGGVPSGYFDPASKRYWTYAHVPRGGVAVIRRAVHAEFSKMLEEADWETVLSGPSVGLTATTSVESPGFAVNLAQCAWLGGTETSPAVGDASEAKKPALPPYLSLVARSGLPVHKILCTMLLDTPARAQSRARIRWRRR